MECTCRALRAAPSFPPHTKGVETAPVLRASSAVDPNEERTKEVKTPRPRKPTETDKCLTTMQWLAHAVTDARDETKSEGARGCNMQLEPGKGDALNVIARQIVLVGAATAAKAEHSCTGATLNGKIEDQRMRPTNEKDVCIHEMKNGEEDAQTAARDQCARQDETIPTAKARHNCKGATLKCDARRKNLKETRGVREGESVRKHGKESDEHGAQTAKRDQRARKDEAVPAAKAGHTCKGATPTSDRKALNKKKAMGADTHDGHGEKAARTDGSNRGTEVTDHVRVPKPFLRGDTSAGQKEIEKQGNRRGESEATRATEVESVCQSTRRRRADPSSVRPTRPKCIPWGLSHKEWNRLMHALHGNTGPPPPKCPDGHCGKMSSRGSGGPGRRQYECRTCGGCFSQKDPKLIQGDTEREARWMRNKQPLQPRDANQPDGSQQQRPKATAPNKATLAICPMGHERCAVGGTTHNHAKHRLRFTCVRCDGDFSQVDPLKVAHPRDREATWLRGHTPEDRAAARGADKHETATPPTCPPATRQQNGRCEGDDVVTYGNAQGLSDARAWQAYLQHMMHSSMHGVLETNWDEPRAEKYANDAMQDGDGRIYAAVGQTTHGCGCALFIRSDVPKSADEGRVYARTDGKAMAVHVTWHGQPTLVVLTHAPHEEEKQVAFYQAVEQELRAVYSADKMRATREYDIDGEVPRRRQVIWMADHNHVADQMRDVQPQDATKATPQAANARRRLGAYLGACHDLYRTLHPNGTAGTRRIPNTNTWRRIDSIHVSSAMLEEEQRFVRIEHVPPTAFTVFHFHDRKRQELKKVADHWLVRATFRTTNIPKAKKAPAFASEVLTTKEGRARMNEIAVDTIAAAKADGDSPERTQERLAQAWMTESQKYKNEHVLQAKKKAAAAHQKLRNLTERYEKATKKVERKQWHAQVERARNAFDAAASARQRQEEERRRLTAIANDDENSKHVHERLTRRTLKQPCAKVCTETVEADGTKVRWEATDNEGIHKVFESHWKPILQMEMDDAESRRKGGRVLQRIEAKMRTRLTDQERAALEQDAILTTANIEAAIGRVRDHTAPGQDGVPIDPYQACLQDAKAKEAVVSHLKELFETAMGQRRMTDNMRESVTSMVHKKGATDNPGNYRPIAVTATEYRILATAMAMRLAQVLHRLIGESQIGFMIERLIGENIDLMMETMRYADNEGSERGGAVIILDNTAAYDHVWRPFLERTLQAFGLPASFRAMVSTLLNGSTTRLKINGTLGGRIAQTSGVRQGCPLSSMLYLFVMEVMLHVIREDARITGIEIPNADGGNADGERAEIRERSLADDLAVYLTNLDTSVPALRDDLQLFKDISGQRIKLAKSFGVLCGRDARRPQDQMQRLWPGMQFGTREECTAVYHGVETTAAEGAATQWQQKVEEIERMMDEDESIFTPRSIAGRIHLAHGRYIGKTAHVFRYHVPEEPQMTKMLDKLQARIKTNVMGGTNWVAVQTAKQRVKDGGIALPHVRSEVEAAWADSVLQLLDGQPRPWKNFSRYQLQRAYGELGRGTRMLTANYGFAKLTEADPTSRSPRR